MSELATFWNEKHPLSAQATALYDRLVPAQGHCETLQGELIRASTRISYDWFNNGWGCNNWSGAVAFLRENFRLLPTQPDQSVLDDLKKALDYVHCYSHGERCGLDYNGKPCEAVTKIHEIVATAILANPAEVKNPCDMFDLSEPDACEMWDDEDDENEDDGAHFYR